MTTVMFEKIKKTCRYSALSMRMIWSYGKGKMLLWLLALVVSPVVNVVSTVVNGRNPIVAHEYLGNDVTGMDIFIADDLISSGESMLDIAYELKKRKARKIIAYATYGLFTAGFEKLDKAYADGVIDGVFGTNLTYIPDELKNKEWFHIVDCSKYVSYFVAALNHDMSVSEILDPHEKIKALLSAHHAGRN